MPTLTRAPQPDFPRSSPKRCSATKLFGVTARVFAVEIDAWRRIARCTLVFDGGWQTYGVKHHVLRLAFITVVLVTTACSSDKPSATTSAPSGTGATTSTDLPGVKSFSGLTRNHVDTAASYPQSPPVGGDHSPIWQNCGIYDSPVANENAVHSLEHGAVWLAYRPDLDATDVEILRSLARGHTHVLVTPYPGLAEPVVATAWGKQLRLDSADRAALAKFVATYEEGKQTPELGVTCGGALGDPIE